MLSLPIAGLLTQFAELPTKREEQKEEDREFAKAPPKKREGIRFGQSIENDNTGDGRHERSLLGRKNNQEIGVIGVQALQSKAVP